MSFRCYRGLIGDGFTATRRIIYYALEKCEPLRLLSYEAVENILLKKIKASEEFTNFFSYLQQAGIIIIISW